VPGTRCSWEGSASSQGIGTDRPSSRCQRNATIPPRRSQVHERWQTTVSEIETAHGSIADSRVLRAKAGDQEALMTWFVSLRKPCTLPAIATYGKAKLNSPVSDGTNSTTVLLNAGGLRLIPRSGNTTREVHSPVSWRSKVSRTGTPCWSRMRSGE